MCKTENECVCMCKTENECVCVTEYEMRREVTYYFVTTNPYQFY